MEKIMNLPSDRFTGVLAAALTPLASNLDPDLKLMSNHCKWLLDNGCDGLAILGTTGEANSLSVTTQGHRAQIRTASTKTLAIIAIENGLDNNGRM